MKIEDYEFNLICKIVPNTDNLGKFLEFLPQQGMKIKRIIL